MTNKTKAVAILMTITTGIFLAPLANAQDASGINFSKTSVSTTAGIHVTIPFGGQNSDRVTDRARVGLMLNMTREYNDRNFYAPKRVNTNLLDFGMQFDGRPTMLISGEDMYTPLFAPLSADEDGNISISKNTVLLAAGAALAVGAAVALAGSDSEDNDDDDRGRDNDD